MKFNVIGTVVDTQHRNHQGKDYTTVITELPTYGQKEPELLALEFSGHPAALARQLMRGERIACEGNLSTKPPRQDSTFWKTQVYCFNFERLVGSQPQGDAF